MNQLLIKKYNQDEIKRLIRIYHWSPKEILDEEIDQLLGIESQKKESDLDIIRLENNYGEEQFDYQGTPYMMIREFIHFSHPIKSDLVYDLGSGFGRVIIYGAIVSSATFKGVELVKERAESCSKVKRNLGLKNLEVICSNVLNQDFSDGNIFFLFNPFKMETLVKVVNQLKEIANNRKITIASWGQSEDYFANQDWLTEQKINFIYQEFPRLKIYQSNSK